MADFLRLFSETPALNLIFIIGALVFVLGVVRKVHTFIELTKAGAIVLIAFGLSLMVFSMAATLVGVIPPREAGSQAATTVPESQELESASPEEPEDNLASDTPNQDVSIGAGALIMVGLIVLLVIFLSIWNSKAGWRFRQNRFGHDPAAYFFMTARHYASQYASSRARKETAPYPGAVIRNLRRAVSWDDTLFEKAENDRAFEKIRETVEYRAFAQEYRKTTEEAGKSPNG